MPSTQKLMIHFQPRNVLPHDQPVQSLEQRVQDPEDMVHIEKLAMQRVQQPVHLVRQSRHNTSGACCSWLLSSEDVHEHVHEQLDAEKADEEPLRDVQCPAQKVAGGNT